MRIVFDSWFYFVRQRRCFVDSGGATDIYPAIVASSRACWYPLPTPPLNFYIVGNPPHLFQRPIPFVRYGIHQRAKAFVLTDGGVFFAFQIDMFVIHRVGIRPVYEGIYAVIIGFVIRPIRIGKQSFWIFRVSAIGIRLTIIRVHA